ncbi:hypothetical protein [Empedobacter sp. ULE_I140]
MSEEDIMQTEKIEQEKKTFAIFSQSSKIQGKSNKSTIDYANGFSILMQRYDSIHHTNISGLVNTTNIIEHKKNSRQNIILESRDFYIETRLHSQTIFDENGDIWVMYPKIKNKQVKDLLIASYTDDGTNVFFSYVKKDSKLFAININLFQLEYDKQFNSSINKKANVDDCGFEGLPSCDLGEVIITPNPGGSGCSNCYTTPPENGGSSGCSQFVECLDNPPGGGGGDGIDPIIDPCLQALINNIVAKDYLNSPEVKETLEKLKKGLPLDEIEKYFLFAKYNSSGIIKPTPIIDGNKGNTGNVSVGPSDTKNILGRVHSHTNGYYSAPSPGDFYFLSNANIKSSSFSFWYTVSYNGDIYVLSINNYHYFIRFQDNFPKDIYLTDKGEWKEGTSIYNDYTNVYDSFFANGKSDNEADFLAMSFITNKFNMGLGISKQDSDGNFNSTFVNESKNQSSGKSEFSESSDCNFK